MLVGQLCLSLVRGPSSRCLCAPRCILMPAHQPQSHIPLLPTPAQPLGKGQLQRLFHNLCANTETREVREAGGR